MVSIKQYEQVVTVTTQDTKVSVKTEEVVVKVKSIESVNIVNDESNSDFDIDLTLLYQTAKL